MTSTDHPAEDVQNGEMESAGSVVDTESMTSVEDVGSVCEDNIYHDHFHNLIGSLQANHNEPNDGDPRNSNSIVLTDYSNQSVTELNNGGGENGEAFGGEYDEVIIE